MNRFIILLRILSMMVLMILVKFYPSMEEKEVTLIEEEYKTWKKNIKYLYDLLFTQSLKWPSTSVQWFPEIERENNSITRQKVLLSTYTSQQEPEHVIIGSFSFPDTFDDTPTSNAIGFSITHSMQVDVEINVSRYCPQASNIIALKTESKDVLIYDTTKHGSFSNDKQEPDAVLTGHADGGYAIDWNKNVFGQLISGGGDNQICLFDINGGLISIYNKIHTDIINQVSYNAFNPNVFASVSDDMKLAITDTRTEAACHVINNAHGSSIETVDYSPFKSELVATAGSDNLVKIWDTRYLESPITILNGHANDVMKVKWSPHYESILATSGKDRRVMIWDLNKSSEVDGDASNELLFVHGGHTNTVPDFDWNPAEPIEICSIADDCLLHVWKIPIEDFI